MFSQSLPGSMVEQRSKIIKDLYESVNAAESIVKENKRPGVAVRRCDDAIETASKILGHDDPHVVDAKEKRAQVLATVHSANPNRAINEYGELLTTRNRIDGSYSRKTAITRLALCRVLWSAGGHRENAYDHLLWVVKTHPDILNLDADLRLATAVGNDLYEHGKKPEAATVFQAILERLKGTDRVHGLRTLEARRRLAMILFEAAGGDVAAENEIEKVEEAYELMEINMSILKNHYVNQFLWDRNSEAMTKIFNVLVQKGRISGSLNLIQMPRKLTTQTHSQGDVGELERPSAPSIAGGEAMKREKSDPISSTKSRNPPPLPPRQVVPLAKQNPPLAIGSQFYADTFSLKAHDPVELKWGSNFSSPVGEISVTGSNIEDELKVLSGEHVAQPGNSKHDLQRTSETSDHSPPIQIPESRSPGVLPNLNRVRIRNLHTLQTASASRHSLNEGDDLMDRRTVTDTPSGDAEGSTLFTLDLEPNIGVPSSYPPGPKKLLDQPRKPSTPMWLDAEGGGRESGFSDLFGEHRSVNAKLSDSWFENLKTTHKLLQRGSSNHFIKVAILDTGLDGEHPFLVQEPFGKGWGEQIKGCISFDEAGQMNTELSKTEWNTWVQNLRKAIREGRRLTNKERSGYRDTHGHGTHCTGILLQVAPNAHIYIAKIGSDENNDPEPDHITQALKHAVDPNEWDVDIISMSFGFGVTNKSHEVIERTIREHSQRQILFAAAANHGSNRRYIAYPARIGRVICVKSSNGHGSPSTFNPREPHREGRCFFTLGEEVLSMWRSSWKENGARILQRRATGTSIATPIAAGIAALILEFINQPDKPKDWPYLKKSLEKFEVDHNDRMTRILEAMSGTEDSKEFGKTRYIVPWSWLKSTSDSDEDHPPMTPRMEAAFKIYQCVKQ